MGGSSRSGDVCSQVVTLFGWIIKGLGGGRGECLYSISVNITFKDQGNTVSIRHLKLQVLREGKGKYEYM